MFASSKWSMKRSWSKLVVYLFIYLFSWLTLTRTIEESKGHVCKRKDKEEKPNCEKLHLFCLLLQPKIAVFFSLIFFFFFFYNVNKFTTLLLQNVKLMPHSNFVLKNFVISEKNFGGGVEVVVCVFCSLGVFFPCFFWDLDHVLKLAQFCVWEEKQKWTCMHGL